MENSWSMTQKDLWQGRDDSKESEIAKRMFQTIEIAPQFSPQLYNGYTAILGYECDEGVKINKGRAGAAKAPDEIRKSFANLPYFKELEKLIDLGNIKFSPTLEDSQNLFSENIKKCHTNNLRTFVLGGGHETAYAHGLGIYKSYTDKRIGVINFDAHLDIRISNNSSSGTPFKQLANFCKDNNQYFNYMCIGVSKAANTMALFKTAEELNVDIIYDTECCPCNMSTILTRVDNFIKDLDVVYITVDLDVLPFNTMYAVSAPAALGVELAFIINVAKRIQDSLKVKAIDLVEYAPDLDKDKLCVRAISRLMWELLINWKK